MTRADQIGHWVEGLVADPDASNQKALVGFAAQNLEKEKPEFSAFRVRNFLGLPDWNLPRPEIIFSITGSASAEFDLGEAEGLRNWFKNRLHEFLARVIFGVAIKKTGWIIDGGTNAGIMKALGNTRQHLMYPPLAPLIGMCALNLNLPQGIDKKPQPDFDSDPESRSPLTMPEKQPKNLPKGTVKRVHPDPNHSHFFMVGPKTKDAEPAFSDENVFRRNFEVCSLITHVFCLVHGTTLIVPFSHASCICVCFM